jgi:Cu(I)/Ag(I) efflux system protein CusF
MKVTSTLSLIAALSLTTAAFVQAAGSGGKEMKDMDMAHCMDMMKGMDMKGMDPQKCKEMMEGMNDKQTSGADEATHKTEAVVKSVDAAQGKVTLAHGPVETLGWPAMTMGFSVEDKALFEKLAVGKKVNVQFEKQDGGYVVTSVE